jgi:hypothetical protein
MFDQPYMESCCRSALHRLLQCDGIGRPPGLKDGRCLIRLADMGLAERTDSGRFVVTEAGRNRHGSEIAGRRGLRRSA